MSAKTVYILHKTGADSHYVALHHLLKQHNHTLEYREFSVFSKIFKSLVKFNFKLFKKQLINMAFLTGLLFSKNKKIVLGIAPFDSKLIGLLKILKHHKVYYHTSWTYWDKTFHPKTKNNSPKVLNTWRNFLEDKAKHIFSVTQKSKQQLLENYAINEEKINVVYHALNPEFSERLAISKKENSFIYYGRLVPQKGIEEILIFFDKHKEATLTLIGDGEQRNLAEKYAASHPNITHTAHISDKKKLITILAGHQYLLLNSKKTSKWEELFGLVIIESMSQGVVPVSSSHSGPKEIISENTGYLFEEGEMEATLKNILDKSNSDEEKAAQCIKTSRRFLPEHIAERWQAILN